MLLTVVSNDINTFTAQFGPAEVIHLIVRYEGFCWFLIPSCFYKKASREELKQLFSVLKNTNFLVQSSNPSMFTLEDLMTA